MQIELQLLRDGVAVRRAPLEATVEIGRRRTDEVESSPAGRFLIAEQDETFVPRSWFSIAPLEGANVRIDNLHASHLVRLVAGETVPPGGSLTVCVPATVRLQEGYFLSICPLPVSTADTEGTIAGIRSLLPLEGRRISEDLAGPLQSGFPVRPLAGHGGSMDPAMVASLVRKALAVVTAAVGSDAFLEAAVRATAEIAGLDRATIFTYSPAGGSDADDSSVQPPAAGEAQNPFRPVVRTAETIAHSSADDAGAWSIRVRFVAEHALGTAAPPVSLTLLRQVRELRTTQIYDSTFEMMSRSLAAVSSVVAAPILDRSGNLAAVLYGDRRMAKAGGEPQITDLEATLVEVLAGAVAAGLARQEEESSRARLSEFFSPRVATLLAENPERLKGRDAEVSVLFCDVRGFSGVTERFGPEKTIEWINDVLTELSRCVVDSDGVLVDYVGDELLAMWGAPQRQQDHASRAMATAMQMFAAVDRLRSRWRDTFAASIDVGIGINSGPARVGNVGSKLKFKYGVLGSTVNIGSRLQGATKQLGTRCLASATTVALADRAVSTRRLAQIRVVGIREVLNVFECVPEADEAWQGLRDEYEAALADFEAGQHGAAVQRLGSLLQRHPQDRPSALLLARAAKQLTDPSAEFASIWELRKK